MAITLWVDGLGRKIEGKCCTAHVQHLFNISLYWTELPKKLERKLNNGMQRQKVYHKATFVISAFKVLNYGFGCQRREQLMSCRWQGVTSARPEVTSKIQNFQNQQSTKVVAQQHGMLSSVEKKQTTGLCLIVMINLWSSYSLLK